MLQINRWVSQPTHAVSGISGSSVAAASFASRIKIKKEIRTGGQIHQWLDVTNSTQRPPRMRGTMRGKSSCKFWAFGEPEEKTLLTAVVSGGFSPAEA
jgi:hypothetical protein